MADIGITAQPPPEGLFEYKHLLNDDHVLVCRPDDALAHKDVIERPAGWEVFQKSRYIASAKGTSTRTATDEVFTQLGLAVRPAHESTSLPIIGGLIAAGLGISVIPTTGDCAMPIATFVSQTNMGQNVQVNNGSTTIAAEAPANGSKAKFVQNELLGMSDGARVEPGTAGQASRSDSTVVPLATVHRATKH